MTELTALRAGRPERDLVVALQDFDRLQQEFVSFADVFASAATQVAGIVAANGRSDGHPAEDAIAKIPLTDLKASHPAPTGDGRRRHPPKCLLLGQGFRKESKAGGACGWIDPPRAYVLACIDDPAQPFGQLRNFVWPQFAKVRPRRQLQGVQMTDDGVGREFASALIEFKSSQSEFGDKRQQLEAHRCGHVAKLPAAVCKLGEPLRIAAVSRAASNAVTSSANSWLSHSSNPTLTSAISTSALSIARSRDTPPGRRAIC